MNKQEKQTLIDTENSTVLTKVGGYYMDKGGQIYTDEK